MIVSTLDQFLATSPSTAYRLLLLLFLSKALAVTVYDFFEKFGLVEITGLMSLLLH